jgi:hypothetical protein
MFADLFAEADDGEGGEGGDAVFKNRSKVCSHVQYIRIYYVCMH